VQAPKRRTRPGGSPDRSRLARETRTGAPNGPEWAPAATALTSRPRCLVLKASFSASWIRA